MKENSFIKRKVLIDITFLFDQYANKDTGVYAKVLIRHLIEEILSSPNWQLSLIGFNDLNKNLINLGFSSLAIEEIQHKVNFFDLGEPVISGEKEEELWDQKYRVIINNERIDLFISSNFERGLPSVTYLNDKLLYKPKTVVFEYRLYKSLSRKLKTLNFFEKIFSENYLQKFWKGVSNADIVIIPSTFAKEQLIQKIKIEDKDLKVIHLGIEDSYKLENLDMEENEKSEILQRFGIQKEEYYIAFASDLDDKKNYSNLLKAIKEISGYKRLHSPQKFVLIGNQLEQGIGTKIKANTEIANNFLRDCKKSQVLSNIISTGKLDDEETLVLLSNSYAYINFVQNKTFNLTALRAISSGALAVLDKNVLNSELFEDAALLFDIDTLKQPGKEIKKTLEDLKDKDKFVKQSMNSVSKYNWEESAGNAWNYMIELFR